MNSRGEFGRQPALSRLRQFFGRARAHLLFKLRDQLGQASLEWWLRLAVDGECPHLERRVADSEVHLQNRALLAGPCLSFFLGKHGRHVRLGFPCGKPARLLWRVYWNSEPTPYLGLARGTPQPP